MVLLALGARRSLLLIAAGARSIRACFTQTLAHIPTKTMILDWYDLQQQCMALSSPIWRGKAARAHFLWRLEWRLWRGDVPAAVALLEA